MSEREPITAELRAALDVDREFMRADGTVVAQTFCVDRGDFERLCDAIDAVHAALERENAALRAKVEELDNADDSMHIGGSITDELRDFARRWPCTDYRCKDMLAIADRIDAEHQREISRAAQLLADAEKDRDFNYANWQDCKQKVLQHSITMGELSAKIERLKDELAHRIKPLKDADGEYIHIGDRMNGTCSSGKHVSGTVRAIGDGVFWLSNVQFSLKPEYMHHYHAPTVEDVLREFADEMNQNLGMYTGEAIDADEWRDADNKTIAEFAAKLRLAEEVDG